MQENHPGTRAYDSIADIVEAGAEAIAISTPADTHIPLAQEALKFGIPVVSDKPFALDARGARETVELAEASNVVLSVYQNRRWDSDFLTVRKLIETAELGASGVSSRASSGLRLYPDLRPRVVARCVTSEVTWSTRRWSCSVL